MVIRYPKEEEEKKRHQTFHERKESKLPCWNIIALTPDSILLQSPKVRTYFFPLTFSEVLLRSEADEDPGHADQQRHHQVNSYPWVQNLVL